MAHSDKGAWSGGRRRGLRGGKNKRAWFDEGGVVYGKEGGVV